MKLFIYGTLKRGCKRNYLLAAAKYLTDLYISEYKLIKFNLGKDSFPILVHTGDILNIVKGEVWEVPDTVVDFLLKHIETGYVLSNIYEDVYAFMLSDVWSVRGSGIQSWEDVV